MAKKTSKGVTPKINYPKEPLIKYVKAAKMYCKTTFENGKQKQEWLVDKPGDENG